MRKALSYLIILVSIGLLLFSRSSFASHTVTPWKGNLPAAVSMTFDDGLPSQITNAVPLLNSRNLKGTFFVISDLNGTTWDQWRQVAAQGHEIGSHTVNHYNLTTLSEADMRYELSESQRTINQNIPSQSCVSFAYPEAVCNALVQSVTSEYYIAARAAWSDEGGELNYYQDIPPEWNQVNFYDVGSQSIPEQNPSIADIDYNLSIAIQYNAWLDMHFHEILDTTFFTSVLDDLLEKNVWIDTFGSIARYMRERMSSTLSVLSEDSNEITLDLTHSLDNSIYNQPLTIRSTIPADWLYANVQQGGVSIYVSSAIEGPETVIYYDAIPNNGTISLTPWDGSGTPTETVSTPTFLIGPEADTTGISYSYSTGGAYSNLGHAVQYQFDWNGDGMTDLSSWGSGAQSKIWTAPGTYYVRTRARCATDINVVSSWSNPIPVRITCFTIGQTSILSIDNSGDGNLLVAYQVSLGQTASILSMSFYVTTASGNLRLGIYDDTGPNGGPGNLKAQTAEFTPTTGWNTQNVVSQVSLPAGTYWLAYLPSSSSLHFRSASSGSAKYYSYTYGPLPASFSTSPSSIAYSWSFYAALQ